MDIAMRIKVVIDYYKMSDRAFALRCGLKQATLDKQLKGLRAVSVETLMGILNTFGDISAEWLMRGVGEMIPAKDPQPDYDKISKLVDTITTLQDALNEKTRSISILNERIRQLENQPK